jgi:hypothetical protein
VDFTEDVQKAEEEEEENRIRLWSSSIDRDLGPSWQFENGTTTRD